MIARVCFMVDTNFQLKTLENPRATSKNSSLEETLARAPGALGPLSASARAGLAEAGSPAGTPAAAQRISSKCDCLCWMVIFSARPTNDLI